ncbi:MAG TPA: glycosyltransferase family 9 protein [Gammaproteobacteria bacterium]|nr:glycosyltransferase family 9 protein [Gammaproteobacteria bacterium]
MNFVTAATGPDWSLARRVLCVRLDNLGDVLMSTPAMRALHEQRPGRSLTLLTSPGGAALIPHLPFVDDAIVYDAPWVKNARTAACDRSRDRALIEALAARRFDAAVIFTVYSQSALPAALTCLLAGIPLRLAYSRENPYALLSDWAPETEPQAPPRHEVARQLDLVARVGAGTRDPRLVFTVDARDRLHAQRRLRARGLLREDRPLVLVHPGASAPSRRYPPALFGAAIDAIAALAPCSIALTGNADERETIDAVLQATHAPVQSLAGELSLGELGATIALAAVLVSNNTGPVHLAAALGTPVVDLYALTNPQHTPWQVPHRLLYHDVPCRYCYRSVCPETHHDCLRQVPPAAVAAAAIELLARRDDTTETLPLPAMPNAAPPALALPA